MSLCLSWIHAGMKYFTNGGGSSDRIYSVLLVVEGGPVTLQVVGQAVENNTPVVVIEGSGRAADLIAYAWRILHCEKYIQFISCIIICCCEIIRLVVQRVMFPVILNNSRMCCFSVACYNVLHTNSTLLYLSIYVSPSTQFFRISELRRMVSNTFANLTKEKASLFDSVDLITAV